MKGVVPIGVAKLLEKFNFREETLYVYSQNEELHLSLEPIPKKISAPTIYEATEFLWRRGLKIYYTPVPETNQCRGIIETKDKKIIVGMFKTPNEAILGCLVCLTS